MRNRNLILPVLAAMIVSHASASFAEVKPAAIFADHMVLQRDRAVPVWGRADAGEKVTVSFAGQKKTTTAGKDGKWMVKLDALKLSARPQTMAVMGRNRIIIKDVLVGDVWLCSGQSNMGRAVNRSWLPDGFSLDYPRIRCFSVHNAGWPYPVETLEGLWRVCDEPNTPNVCAVGFFFARRVHEETGVPIGLLWSAWAGSTIDEWIPQFGWRLVGELKRYADEVDSWYPNTKHGRAVWKRRLSEIEAWLSEAEDALAENRPFPYPQPMMPEPPRPQKHPRTGKGMARGTTTLYNGKIHPLVPYAIKGILWYQGESDSRTADYALRKKAMVQAWRRLFADGEEIPFYYVQIQRSGDYCSPLIRDQQLKALHVIPNCGMAVLLDLDVNVHPQNKYDSGERLALWALAKDYGKTLVYSGPLYRSHEIEGGRIVIEFDHAESGLMIGRKDKLNPPEELPDAELTNVKIAGKGGKWHQARAKIVGKTLVVWSDQVPDPVDVRYCYANIPKEPFLYNKAGLPAAQFRTDQRRR